MGADVSHNGLLDHWLIPPQHLATGRPIFRSYFLLSKRHRASSMGHQRNTGGKALFRSRIYGRRCRELRRRHHLLWFSYFNSPRLLMKNSRSAATKFALEELADAAFHSFA